MFEKIIEANLKAAKDTCRLTKYIQFRYMA